MGEEKTKSQKLREIVSKELFFMTVPSSEASRVSSLYRHNVSRRIGENPELYGRLLQKLPVELHRNEAEQAAYTALTLAAFAGNHGSENMAKVIGNIPHNESLVKRFRRAETADDIDELRYLLRSVLKLVASQGRSVNYANLASDLYAWQYSKAKQIRRWERDIVG